jgi:hypothetical protein
MKSKMLDEQIIMKGKNETYYLQSRHLKNGMLCKNEKKGHTECIKKFDKINPKRYAEIKTSGLGRKFFFTKKRLEILSIGRVNLHRKSISDNQVS